jgi:hypothetical protein
VEKKKIVLNELLQEHKAKMFVQAEEEKFVVMICGPSDVNKPETKFKLKLKERLVAEKFEVYFGEDDGLEELRDEIGLSALDNELQFARISCRAVIIIAGSSGTFSELGAFAVEHLEGSKKLLIAVLKGTCALDSSFINAGPRKRIEQNGGKIIDSSFDQATIDDISERLNKLRLIYVGT